MNIEIFAMDAQGVKKVGCSTCPLSCASRDQVAITPQSLATMLSIHFGESATVTLYDYQSGDQEAILKRQNELYESNGVPRRLNKVIMGPIAGRIWPSVVVDDKILSEGALLDTTSILAHL